MLVLLLLLLHIGTAGLYFAKHYTHTRNRTDKRTVIECRTIQTS